MKRRSSLGRSRAHYAAWLDEYHAAAIGLFDQATQSRQQTEDEVRARLVAIGYVTGPGTELLPERIIPDFLMRHPSVRAARFRQSDVETIQTSITTVQSANEKARTETTAQMAQYRDRMLAVV